MNHYLLISPIQPSSTSSFTHVFSPSRLLLSLLKMPPPPLPSHYLSYIHKHEHTANLLPSSCTASPALTYTRSPLSSIFPTLTHILTPTVSQYLSFSSFTYIILLPVTPPSLLPLSSPLSCLQSHPHSYSLPEFFILLLQLLHLSPLLLFLVPSSFL